MTSFFSDITVLNTRLADLAKPYTMVFVLSDENTEKYCLPLIRASVSGARIIIVQSGEINKNLKTCEHIWTILTESLADRKALLINLGGGVITDMGGFAAACYKRGIDFINIPTTLLGMVDASVGGKTGVDFDNFKNQIGVFSEAKDVLICNEFLKTLPERQLKSGLAEVLKHYLIADGQAFRDFTRGDHLFDIALINKAVNIKSHIVSQDPYETGIRKGLNFGHTVGHALESYYMDRSDFLLHGEAVAMGMTVEAFISAPRHFLDEASVVFIVTTLHSFFALRLIPSGIVDDLIALMLQDKKNQNGIMLIPLLNDIGSFIGDVPVSSEEITRAIEKYNAILSK